MKKTIVILVVSCFLSNYAFCQKSTWKNVNLVLKDVDLNQVLNQITSNNLMNFFQKTKLDSCINPTDTMNYQCYFGDFLLLFVYIPKSFGNDYLALKKDKKEIGIRISKKYSPILVNILKEKKKMLKKYLKDTLK